MKKIFTILSCSLMLVSCTSLNQLGGSLGSIGNTQNTNNVTNTAIKDLLLKSALSGIGNLGTTNGFLNNQLYKILLPPEARKVANTLQSIGLGSVVTKAQTQINHAAEQAIVTAKPIFVNAVKSMTLTDAIGLVRGGDNAITQFFKNKTTTNLLSAFSPIIKDKLGKNDATKYYGQLATAYNQLPFSKNKLNPDLTNYVANQAINALFSQMSVAEKNIRHNPVEQTTAALKQIFGGK